MRVSIPTVPAIPFQQIDADVASITADGAYDGQVVYDAVAERHPKAAVIVPPRITDCCRYNDSAKSPAVEPLPGACRRNSSDFSGENAVLAPFHDASRCDSLTEAVIDAADLRGF